jgi:GTP-binding protein
VALLAPDGSRRDQRIKRIELFDGLQRVAVDQVAAGEIAAIVGLEGVTIGATITDVDHPDRLDSIRVEEPTISMIFSANDGPLRGQEGDHVTSRKLRDRLMREVEANVALRVKDTPSADAYEVSGRGVLHLGILIERMRREGYEFCVSRPRVILHQTDGGVEEPFEEAIVEVPPDMTGKVMSLFGARRGELGEMETRGERVRMHFQIPSRGLIGLRNLLLNATQGEATLAHRLTEYRPWRGEIPGRKAGVQISDREGVSTPYALYALQERGPLFIRAGTRVYEGMITGEHCHESDLVVNVCREKQLTNFRAAGSDKNVMLSPPVAFSVEEALEYIDDDELVEVTPESLRMRKRVLGAKARKRAAEAEQAAQAAR